MASKSIILGSGGHARVLMDVLTQCRFEVVGYSSLQPNLNWMPSSIPYIERDEDILRFDSSSVSLINGVGSVGNPSKRVALYNTWVKEGYVFQSLSHPRAIVADDATIKDGVQIMAGAIVQPGCVIGSNSIVNTGASVDHECTIGKHVHIAPGAVLCGDVIVEDEVHIGAGAILKQGIRVGRGSIIGAGAVVVSSVSSGKVVIGIPAKEVAR